MGMLRRDAFEILAARQGDSLVVAHFGPTRPEWFDASGGRRSFFLHGGMGMACSTALGLALALPHRAVWVLEGDGALQLNLGSLLTLAQFQPANLVQFVLCNRTYEAVGSQPIVGGRSVDFAALARAAGLENVHSFESLDDLEDGIDDILGGGRFAFVALELEGGSTFKEKMPWDPVEAKYRFGREIEELEGIQIFRQ